jgi:RNA polymerase sigma factor (sigma-70 family)
MSALPSIEPAAVALEAEQTRALYEQYSRRIFGRLPSREEAEDAVQHTFMNAFGGLRKGVVPRSEAAWLFKIAENVCRERRRSAWRRGRVEATQDPEALQNLAVAPQGSHDELTGLADALAELPPNQRRAILLREWQGLSYKEIATELELTDAAVETLLFRARRGLARKLDRSRGRNWGLNLGSLASWAKSLLGGSAVKVAAATLAVAAGVTAATPAFRDQVVGKRSTPTPLPADRAKTEAPSIAQLVPFTATSSHGAPSSALSPARQAVTGTKRQVPTTTSTEAPALPTTPSTGVVPVPGAASATGALPVPSTDSVQAPPVQTPPVQTPPVQTPPVQVGPVHVPPVQVPPVQVPGVQVPAVPAVPAVTVPILPVQVPSLPKLP